MRQLLIHHSRQLQAKAIKVKLVDFTTSPGIEVLTEIEAPRLDAVRPRSRRSSSSSGLR